MTLDEMTPAQFDRLPPILRELVEVDRRLDELRGRLDWDTVLVRRGLMERRIALRKRAEADYGHRLGGDRQGSA